MKISALSDPINSRIIVIIVCYRLLLSLLFMLVVWWTPMARTDTGDYPLSYFATLIVIYGVHQVSILSSILQQDSYVIQYKT